MVEMMMVNTMAGRTPGMVMRRNCCQRLAPSIAAASYSSAEIVCIEAR